MIKESEVEEAVGACKPVQLRFEGSDKAVAITLPSKAGDTGNLKDIVTACSPASFGRGGEDIFDESYRNAGKLDLDKFLTSFCPYTTGIIDVVSQLLLPNAIGSERRGVTSELYKLNTYSAPNGKFKVSLVHICIPGTIWTRRPPRKHS